MTNLENNIKRLVKRVGKPGADNRSCFGVEFANALEWGMSELSRVDNIKKENVSLNITQGYIGEEPAFLFLTHDGKLEKAIINQALSYAYHSTIEWGVLTNSTEVIVFNSHWILDNEWFHFPAFTVKNLLGNIRILEGLTPDGIMSGRIDSFAAERYRPDRLLAPVDDALVDILDEWRDVAMKHSWTAESVDEDLQTFFAQLFILRAVEDRSLITSIPSLREVRNKENITLQEQLDDIYAQAKLSVQSELFDFRPYKNFPDFIIEGILSDFYRPRYYNLLGLEYNFAWIEADVLGRAYEKYLSSVLVPVQRTDGQLSLFDEPQRDVQRMSRRKAAGVYYTPEFVSRYITEKAIYDIKFEDGDGNIRLPRIADITCGSGSFLRVAADVLIRRLRSLDSSRNWGQEIVKNQSLIGIDIDPKAVMITKLALWLTLSEEPNPLPLPLLGKSIICADALSTVTWDELPSEYDVILGNPPFIASPNIADQRDFALSFITARGRFDYSSLFIEQSIKKLKTGGILGLVVPNRILSNSYASSLREFVSEEARLLSLIDFGSTEVFLGTSTYVALLFAVKQKGNKADSQLRVVHVNELPSKFPSSLLHIGEKTEGTISNYQIKAYNARHPQGSSPWTLMSERSISVRIRLEGMGVPLGELAEVYQGIKTGANDIFVVEWEGESSSHLCKIRNGFDEEHIIEKGSSLDRVGDRRPVARMETPARRLTPASRAVG